MRFDRDGLSRFPIRGDLQDCRAAEAAMCEENVFAECGAAAADGCIERDAAQFTESAPFLVFEHEWNEAGARLRNGEAKLAGDPVAEVGGADFGNRESACCDHKRFAFEFLPVCRDPEPRSFFYTADGAVRLNWNSGSIAFV